MKKSLLLTKALIPLILLLLFFGSASMFRPHPNDNRIPTINDLSVGFIYDFSIHSQENQQRRNYWYVYTKEICNQLGIKINEISASSIKNDDVLANYSVVFVGGGIDEKLSEAAILSLEKWVENGGVLIGFKPTRLDSIFGVRYRGFVQQTPDDYTVTGYFSILDEGIGKNVHSTHSPEQNLLILSDIRLIFIDEANPIGYLFRTERESTNKTSMYPAITERSLGNGKAYYFSFDVPKTIWLLQQGRPVWEDIDGDGWLRTQDMILTKGNRPGVLYADEIKFLIQKMMAHSPIPFIHQIPPIEGQIADSFFHWSGDDDADKGMQVLSSRFMKSRRLPYQINAMPYPGRGGSFHISDEDIQEIRANGHVISLHYNFVDGWAPGDGFTEADVIEQITLFKNRFGNTPISAVNHWIRWYGWTEPARWMAQQGQLASQDMIHIGYPPANPMDIVSFAFGTALPYYVYEDYTMDNQRLEFIQIPHNGHELRSRGNIDKIIDIALKYQVPLSMFYHPIYLVSDSRAQQAVDYTLWHLEKKNAVIYHMTTSDAAIWWRDRDQSIIDNIIFDENHMSFTVYTQYPEGVVIKFAADRIRVLSVEDEQGSLKYEVRNVLGIDWVFVVVPKGHAKVDVVWSN